MPPPARSPDAPEIPELSCPCGTSVFPGAAILDQHGTSHRGLLAIVSPRPHRCCWTPTNTSSPISNSCILARNLQSGCRLHLIPPGSMCSMFPLEKLLVRARVLPPAPLAGPGRAGFLRPLIKHSTTSQGLARTLTSGHNYFRCFLLLMVPT